MDVFFQMRFSYCGKPNGLVNLRTKKTQEICEEETLRKFELLERLTLPSLKEQSDPKFKLILLSSARMPSDCKDHLTWLLNHYLPGRSEAIYARPMVAGRVFRGFMQNINSDGLPVIQTQTLNGDAYGKGFVQTLREHAVESWANEQSTGKGGGPSGTFMSFKRGFHLKLNGLKPAGLEATTSPSVPFGLSLVARPSGRYNPELITPDVLGTKLPHLSIRTRSIHCMRVVTGDAARHMPPIEAGLFAQAQQEFGVLRSAHGIASAQRPLKKPMSVTGVAKLRRAG